MSGGDIELQDLSCPAEPIGGGDGSPSVQIVYTYQGKTSTGVCRFSLNFLDVETGSTIQQLFFDGVFISQSSTSPPNEYNISICDNKVRTLTISPKNAIPSDCTLTMNFKNVSENIVDIIMVNNNSELQMNVCPQSRTYVDNILHFDQFTYIRTDRRQKTPPCGIDAQSIEDGEVKTVQVTFV